MAPVRFREHLLAPSVWVVAGFAWVLQLTLHWTSSGTFSTSSLADGIRLIRAGAVSSVVPSWVALVLLVLPAVGLGLVVLAMVDGGVAGSGRSWLAVLGVGLVGASVWFLAEADPARLGPGGWTAVSGALLAVGAIGLDVRASRLGRIPLSQEAPR